MLSPAWLAISIIGASAGDPALSARLKALVRDVKCLAQLKVRKQCLRIVCWLPIHHHRRRTPAHWQSSALLRSRNQPVLGRRHRFSADYPPMAEECRANLLPAIPHRQCLPKLLSGQIAELWCSLRSTTSLRYFAASVGSVCRARSAAMNRAVARDRRPWWAGAVLGRCRTG